MKRKFSCFVMIMAMFLCGTSGYIQAMQAVGGAFEKTAYAAEKGAAIGEKAALEALSSVGLKLADDAAIQGLAKTMATGAKDALTAITTKYTSEFAAQGANHGVLQAAMDVEVKAVMDGMAQSVSKLSAAGIKVEGMSAGALGKLASGTEADFAHAVDSMTVQATDDAAAAQVGKLSQHDATKLKQEFAQSKSMVPTHSPLHSTPTPHPTTATATSADAGRSLSYQAQKYVQKGSAKATAKVSDMIGTTENSVSRLVQKDQEALTEARQMLKTATNEADRSAAAHTVAKLEWKAATNGGKALRLLKATAGHASGPLMMMGGTIVMAVLFMIPSIFQSAFLAQQQQNALLQTYIPPTKFGNVVLQLPDSVIDVGNPASSQFIYYGIPVNNPGEKISSAAAAAYPGVSGPDKNNKISAGVNNAYAQAFSLGATKQISIPRYNLDANALSTLPIFVSYTDQSWSDWAANGIPDAAFNQSMINLNTGYIFYADGTSSGTPAAGLVGTTGSAKTVQSFISKKLGQLKSTGSQATYTQYVNAYSSAKADVVTSPLANQFNCACLENNGGALSADTLQTCSGSKASTCVLTSALNQLSAGLVINAQGMVMTPDQDLAAEIAKGALGQVVPIQGLGKNFDTILQLFPGAEKDTLADSGVLTISLGSNLSSATPIAIQGADPDNYTAKGVYVYQCKNTPLAKMLKSQAGGSGTTSYNDQITDFIVFLDQDLNQVPMMVPVSNPKNYNFMTMGLNPVIKYVSTIVGSVDASGAFAFLPQLNIQSPAALIAKGLPASFFPLYGLQASNGSLTINYNQNLSSTIGTISQALLGHAKLGQQFKSIQSAMLRLLAAGPFGKYNLKPVDPLMQPVIGGVNLMMYTGYNGYPVSQDASNSTCTDVLIPLSAQGKTVTLPSTNVTQYYGLVTDLTYSVRADGTIAVDATGFANSPLSQAGAIDSTKAAQFYWINKLTTMGKSADPAFVMPKPLVDFVTQARKAWMQWVQATSASSTSPQQFSGVTVAGTSNVFVIANQQALSNGLNIYTYSPCPSSLSQDYFILTNSASPQAADATLGSLSATAATAATNMLSIVSGLLYNASGTQVKNSAGAAYSVDPAALLQALNTKSPQAFSNDFKAKLNIVAGQASSAAQALVYPFQFGGLQLGIYQADLNVGTYLYVDASGAGTSASFQPADYFVAIDSYTSPSQVGTQLASTTQYMVSLVSGQVYGPTGAQAMMPSSAVASLIGRLSPAWRSGVVNQITSLIAHAANIQQINQQQTAAMNAVPVQNSGAVTLPVASVTAIIANLALQDYLPDPYSMLKQDSASGSYILLSPASIDGTQFMYTFFDVANSFVDANGHAMHVGASYDEQSNLLRVIQGIELASMMGQYGIAIDSTGRQYLGANNILPVMQLDPADLALQPGASGKSMICSNDPAFPSHDIVSPISYQNSQFYIYFNTITQGYYAMQVNGSTITYIDIAGGNVYNQKGAAQIALNPVGVNSSGDMTDLFLPYLNPDSFVRCVMKNNGNNNIYSDFINSETDFNANASDVATNNPCGLNSLYSVDATATNVSVAQMPFPATSTVMPDLSVANQYNVYWNQSTTPVTYNINPTYTWQQLQILPIDMTSRALLNPLPADMYSSVSLISKSNAPYACIFAHQLYSNVQQSGATGYTMTSGTNSLTLSMNVDSKTNVPYVAILVGGVTYNYQLMFKSLTQAQLLDYRSNLWQGDVIADVTGKILLEKYLAADASGNVTLSPASMSAVVNAPSDAPSISALTSGLVNIMQDKNGRFVAAVSSTAYPYFTQGGYVDIENGALFDGTGILVGYTLQIADLMKLLSQLSVSVVRNSTNKAALRYRAPMSAASSSQATAISAVIPSVVGVAASTSGVNGAASGNQSRSNLLGRLSSKLKRKKNK